jgi:hypothetical protein
VRYVLTLPLPHHNPPEPITTTLSDISRFERLPKKQQIDELRRLDIVVKDEKATKSAFEKQYNAYIGGEDHTHSEGGEDTTPKVCVASLLFKVRG